MLAFVCCLDISVDEEHIHPMIKQLVAEEVSTGGGTVVFGVIVLRYELILLEMCFEISVFFLWSKEM